MKKMMYGVLALMISCVMLSAWTTENKLQPALSATTNPAGTEEENIVYITAEGYDKPDLWVGKDQPVTFINIHDQVHTVTHDYGEFDSGPLKQGESFTISFPNPGTWTYHDEYSKATGMISVIGRDGPRDDE